MKTIGYAQSYVGRRSNNEDSHLCRPELGLYVIADGMGGHEGGEVASNLAVDIVHHFFERMGDRPVSFAPTPGGSSMAEELMAMAIRMADREVERERVGSLAEMGTTLAAVLLREGRAIIGHVGDSRVYRFRSGKLERLTRDHSLYAEMESAGVAAAVPAARAFGHVVTRAVGVPGSANPDLQTVDARPGDLFLLCTDGLTDVVEDARIEDVLRAAQPGLAASALVGEAWVSGSRDNITVLLAQLPPLTEQ